MIGANVMEKDTHNGTISDFDGQFTLQVPDKAFIRISYIGYLPREIPVKGRTNFSIVLQEDKQTLEDVVVVGYGTLKNRPDRISLHYQSTNDFQCSGSYP